MSLICMFECFASMYINVLRACLMPTEARRRSQHPLELELQTGTTYYVGSGSQTWVLCERSGCF